MDRAIDRTDRHKRQAGAATDLIAQTRPELVIAEVAMPLMDA
jgi:YesN/AraC family two-component response regulator